MNESLFRIINNWAGQNIWLDRLMIFSADWLGYVMIAFILILATRDWPKYKEALLLIFGSALVARVIFVEIIRAFYLSPRPFMVIGDINQLIDHELTSSFPSGHATFYFALATGVYLYNKKAGTWCLVVAGLISFARIFVGVHWPLDVVAGATLGGAVAISSYYIKIKSQALR